MIVVKWWQKFFFSLSSWFVNILQTNVQTAVPQLLERRAKTRKDSSAQMFYSNLLDLSQSYLVIWSSHCKLCCTCGLLAVQCNQAVIYILSPVMIALKNVLWWICSLMHGKLLLALMGAVCAGEGERHLPPAFKSRLIVFCLCLALCVGCQKQRTTENFVVFFFSFFIVIIPLPRIWPLCYLLAVCREIFYPQWEDFFLQRFWWTWQGENILASLSKM